MEKRYNLILQKDVSYWVSSTVAFLPKVQFVRSTGSLGAEDTS